MSNLGITSPTFAAYYAKIKSYLNTWTGVESICTAFKGLQNCVKSNTDCINKDDLGKLKNTGDNGPAYAGNYYAFEYMCGDGKNGKFGVTNLHHTGVHQLVRYPSIPLPV